MITQFPRPPLIRVGLERDRSARVDAAARAERVRPRDVVAQAPACCVLRGPDHVVEVANDAYLTLVSNRAVVGKPLREALPELVEEGVVTLLDHVYATGVSVIGQERSLRLEQGADEPPQDLILSFTYQPLRDANGQVTGIIVQALNITERVQAERELQLSQRFLQATLDALTAHIAVVDETGRIIAVNAAWRAFAKANGLRSSDHGLGTNYLAVSDAATGEAAAIGKATAEGIRAVLAGQRNELVLEYPCHAPDEDRWFIVRVTPLAGLGRPCAVIAHENITARKRAELERTAFLDAVVHDVKNPLTVAKGQAQLLRQRLQRGLTEPELLRRGVDGIAAAIDGADGLLDEILDVAHLRSGRPLELHLAPADLVALVREVVAALQKITSVHTVRVETERTSLVGQWDEARLRRVLDNLLGNAIKYSPTGGDIVVRIDREADDSGTWAVVAVSDRGMGIPAADLPRLFERFHRAGNVASIRGTGIGLAGTKQIIAQHGGTIDVASVEGQGSTFTVRLPGGASS